jgi:Carboxypeptidase regulatory-like domain/TonB dependent receptor
LGQTRKIAFLVITALPGAWGPALAQETTATITGVVTDQTGAALPGTGIIAQSVSQGFVKEAVTSMSGAYTVPFLPVGDYEVTFTLSGFQTFVARGIRLHVNDRLTVNAALRVEGQQETLEVTAADQIIQPRAAVQSLMGPVQVQELPLNNRNFVQLATLVPGVTSSLSDEVGIGLTSTVSVSIAGARRSAVNWFVDGASNVDVGSNITLLSTPTLESIEEFRIITSGYNAEWPRSGGGIVNVVTKSGSNRFRTSAYAFLRNDALNANSFFRKQSADPAIRDHPPRLRYDNFGYTLGGRAVKDKLFFFWSQEWRQISRAPASVVAQVPDPAWLADPTNANYVAPALRDPNAVKLLSAWPTPNLGRNAFQDTRPNDQDTRQEVLRVDWQMAPRWRFMARYTHDASETTEAGGLFFNTPVPNIATTKTRVPGHLAVAQLTTTISPRMLNELSLRFSGNAIKSTYAGNVRNTRDQFGISVPELFPDNREGLIPQVAVTGLSSLGSTQLFDNRYRNHTVTDSLSYQRGNHTWKSGFLFAFEQKDELSTSLTQGSFTFAAGGGFTAFQNFLRGNADGACGAACLYSEVELEIGSRLRFNRYEVYVQDSWKLKPGLTVDLGLRYGIAPAVTDARDLLTNFAPSRFDESRVPTFANPAGTNLVTGTGDPQNGIVVAGRSSPHGRAIYGVEKNNLQPRIGFSWDVKNDGRTVGRGGFGIYYDQPLVGVFLQNASVNPPLVSQPSVLNAQLSNPAAGQAPTTRSPLGLIATSDPFETPRTLQWNAGVQRRLYQRGVIDVGYVGSAGDHLIQPVDINQPQPPDVVALASVNRARPYPGYGSITYRQTTAKARYHGLLVGFRHEGGRAGTLNVAYTLSRSRTDASNDRDAIDLPQNPRDLGAEYALSRTDRTHVFTANYVYELPFFKSARGWRKGTLGGWQVSGITQLWSGPPISRVVNGTTNGGRRGIRVNQAADPFANVPEDVIGGVYWFNPAAFTSPADGTYGGTGRAIFRLPGVSQWDITLSKNWYPSKATRLQLRADFINAFNHTQLDPSGIQNVCGASVGNPTCAVLGSSFGQITATRSPREIQLGLRFTWN